MAGRTRAWIAAAAGVLASAALIGCDIDALTITQYGDGDGGALDSDVIDLMADPSPPEVVEDDGGDWPDPFVGELGAVHWGSGELGGATASFEGIAGEVCLIVDPQTVWRDDWARTDEGDVVGDSSMHNYLHDDGDLDMIAGLSADYTGTPGEIIGSFERTFVDPNGVERKADFNLCIQYDQDGIAGGTAGRATPEWCTIDTEPGVNYTVALRTYSVPIDDDKLRFAFQIRAGACPTEVDECTLIGDADPHPLELTIGNETFSYDDLEERYCDPDHL